MSIGFKGDIKPKVYCGKSRTKQSFKSVTNINELVARYRKTGVWSSLQAKPAVFADLANMPDYQESMNRVIAAREAFDSLPAAVRSRFRNDPGELLAFVRNEANYDEAVKLGLVVPKPKEKPAGTPAGGPAAGTEGAPVAPEGAGGA